MNGIIYFLAPLSLFGGSMLLDAELIGQQYALQIAKTSPPPATAQTRSLLDVASVWFSIDLNTLFTPKNQSALEMISQEEFWNLLVDLGVQGLYLEQLKEGGSLQTGLGIHPKWGAKEWPKISMAAQKRGIALIGDCIGYATGAGKDFELALKNEGDYPSLYHLIEIDPANWNLLPAVSAGAKVANISWLNLQELYKRGYISEKSQSYVKESNWNATKKIIGSDGISRRWIYLKQNKTDPVLSWLSSSFATQRLASGDTLNRFYNLNQKIGCLDVALPSIAKEVQSLWMRKIGGFSMQKNSRTLQEMKSGYCDAVEDTLTRAALLHALIAEDCRALRWIYHLFLQENIPSMNLVHVLQPFDLFACDWTELAFNPKKTYTYFEEQMTGELLRDKLLQEDLFRLNTPKEKILPLSTWTGYCSLSPSVVRIQDFEKKQKEIQKIHLLLALIYAMQPGIFSFSAADILGALPNQATQLDLMGTNPNTLYPSLSFQLQNPHSFASQLKKILHIRQISHIAQGELLAVAPVFHTSSLLLIYRLPKSRFIQLLAVNLGSQTVEEKIEIAAIQQTSAIELLSSLSAEKVFDSSTFSFQLAPLSGKVFLFQPKYFD